MRFIKAFTHQETGELRHVRTSDLPFDEDDPPIHEIGPSGRLEFDVHELGAAEHFAPAHAETGARCSPAAHLFQRLEAIPGAPLELRGWARFRVRAGCEPHVPAFHDVPTTLEGLRAHLRRKGLGAVPERVAHWLEFVGALSGDEMLAHGLPRITIARAAEFDAIWLARHPSAGSRLEVFKRQIRERATLRAAARRARGG